MNGRLEQYKEYYFPRLKNSEYEITSPATRLYNCFAWAAKENNRWWDPSSPDGYWPDGVERELTITAMIKAYQTIGYEPCDNTDLELGFEKIAIYVDENETPTHIARQLPDGKWTSKLGNWEDIKHELEDLVNPTFYGSVKQILQRLI